MDLLNLMEHFDQAITAAALALNQAGDALRINRAFRRAPIRTLAGARRGRDHTSGNAGRGAAPRSRIDWIWSGR